MFFHCKPTLFKFLKFSHQKTLKFFFLTIYTKSFGEKIWKYFHSVSPGYNFGKKINGVPLKIFLIKNFFKEYDF